MNQEVCDTLRDRLPLVAAGVKQLSGEDREHLERCADCATEWHVVQQAARLGTAVAERLDTEALAGTVVERLRTEPPAGLGRPALGARGWWAAGLVAAAAVFALVVLPSIRNGAGDSAPPVATASLVPELDGLETSELLVVLNALDGTSDEYQDMGLPLTDDLETQELEQVLQAWEG